MKRLTRLLTKSFSLYRGLPRAVYALFFAQVVNPIDHLVFPFLTFFLTQRLGYDSGAAGVFIFVASTAFVPGSLVGGKFADTLGRKRSNLFGGAANPCHEAITTDIT